MENQDDLISNESYSGKQNRTILDRAFSPIHQGSLRGSVLNLCCTAIGAGCLTLSFAVDQAGLLAGIIILCIGALAAYWSLNNLILTSKEVQSTNYMVVCERAVGKWLGVFLEIIMILSLQGIIILYQIMSIKIIAATFKSFNVELSSSLYPHIIIVQTIIIILPLCLLPRISALSYASLLSICSLSYLVVLVIIEMPYYLKHFTMPDLKLTWVNTNLNSLFSAFIIILFSYICQSGVFTVLHELKEPTLRRMKKVASISIITDFIFYLIIAVGGYVSTKNYTPEMITDREPYTFGKIDYFMNVGRIFLYIAIIIHIPINYHPLRRSIFNMVFSSSQKIEGIKSIAVTLVSLCISDFVAIVYPNIASVINIVGGYCGVMLAFIIPAIVYISACKPPLMKKVFYILLSIVIGCSGIYSASYSIYQDVTGN